MELPTQSALAGDLEQVTWTACIPEAMLWAPMWEAALALPRTGPWSLCVRVRAVTNHTSYNRLPIWPRNLTPSGKCSPLANLLIANLRATVKEDQALTAYTILSSDPRHSVRGLNQPLPTSCAGSHSPSISEGLGLSLWSYRRAGEGARSPRQEETSSAGTFHHRENAWRQVLCTNKITNGKIIALNKIVIFSSLS